MSDGNAVCRVGLASECQVLTLKKLLGNIFARALAEERAFGRVQGGMQFGSRAGRPLHSRRPAFVTRLNYEDAFQADGYRRRDAVRRR